MNLTILGYNSAIPTIFSHPSSQYLNIDSTGIIIDCGEGTQVQLKKAKIKFNNIQQIFISHLHGDHILGLLGLISTFSLIKRTTSIEIFGPLGIKKFINYQIDIMKLKKEFIINIYEITSTKSELILNNSKYSVFTIPLKHRIYTNGYLFKEKKKKRKLNLQEIKKYPEIQIHDYKKLQHGEDIILSNGLIIKNHYLTFNPPNSKSYAYCSDTIYNKEIIPIIKESNILYHESTFLHKLKKIAIKTGHSTALEAGKIAYKAKVKKLILGHFSNRYTNYNLFLNEAKTKFKKTYLPNLYEKIEI